MPEERSASHFTFRLVTLASGHNRLLLATNLRSEFPGYAAASIKPPAGQVDNWLSYLPSLLLADFHV